MRTNTGMRAGRDKTFKASSDSILWLSTHRHGTEVDIVEHHAAWSTHGDHEDSSLKKCPSLIAFIGSKSKAAFLRSTFPTNGESSSSKPHGQIRIWTESTSRESLKPLLLLDCEMQDKRETQSVRQHSTGRETIRRTHFAHSHPGQPNQRDQRTLGFNLYSQVVRPFANVICFFSEDLGGIHGVSDALTSMSLLSPDSRRKVPPHCQVVVVLLSESNAVDPGVARETILQSVQSGIKRYKSDVTARAALDIIKTMFADINVLMPDGISPGARASGLLSRILDKDALARTSRLSSGEQYSASHMAAFISQALDMFVAAEHGEMNLVQACRKHCGPSAGLKSHIQELLTKAGTQSAISVSATPFIASALVLNALPPRMHAFPPEAVFDELYLKACSTAIQDFTHDNDYHHKFVSDVKAAFMLDYTSVASTSQTAVQLHTVRLQSLRSFIAPAQSNRTCLCCLMRSPEKVLSCAHAFCDICIQTFGRITLSMKYTYAMRCCCLCGHESSDDVFQLIPPTASTRILSLDGGGVRGIIPLTWLKDLESRLSWLQCPLRDHFDLVCGTSSGGLIILGLFIMSWNASECIEKFHELSTSIFRRRTQGSTVLARLQEVLVSYLADCKYDSLGIERALYGAFGDCKGLFNPLRNDTRVAVTSTTARDSTPCLFTNYNGAKRTKDLGYNIIRASSAENDASVSDAARCTSAAPWYFPVKALKHLGTFQDGGLHHNNPVAIALWEARFLWPQKSNPDLVLSLGTGASVVPSPKARQGVFSPVKDRFLPRLFKSFMFSMDGDRAWSETINTMSPRSSERCYRLNITLEEQYLKIDDVVHMMSLQRKAEALLEDPNRLSNIYDALFAAAFYLELDSLPAATAQGIRCNGTIFCRLNIPRDGRRALYEHLYQECFVFVSNGTPVPAATRIPQYSPMYKRKVKFVLEKYTDTISVTLRSAQTDAFHISGLPNTLENLISLQMLDTPFGRSDHGVMQKPLPQVPCKRTAEDEDCFALRRTPRKARRV